MSNRSTRVLRFDAITDGELHPCGDHTGSDLQDDVVVGDGGDDALKAGGGVRDRRCAVIRADRSWPAWLFCRRDAKNMKAPMMMIRA